MIIEIFYMFLENKNCFLLFYYNEKKKVELRLILLGMEGVCVVFYLDK